jgi:hypothetical protein
MIDIPPLLQPAPAPVIQLHSETDLECLGLGLDLTARAAEGGPAADFGPLGERLTRFYLARLQASGPGDWRALAKPLPRLVVYAEFMSLMNQCVPPVPPADQDPGAP